MPELKIPSWEVAKEIADKLPGQKSGNKPESKDEGKGSSPCEVAERNKQTIRGKLPTEDVKKELDKTDPKDPRNQKDNKRQ